MVYGIGQLGEVRVHRLAGDGAIGGDDGWSFIDGDLGGAERFGRGPAPQCACAGGPQVADPVRLAARCKPSTPTPRGEFFVEEAVQLPDNEVGAPFTLALSARSSVLQEFAGGPGQIALHGVANIGGVLGTAVSHGCVRLDTRAIGWLVARVGPGTPVTITS